ncbi:hypothetical protein JW877_02830, partial [bacterium]|nr:hypothetical protein [bacterium]
MRTKIITGLILITIIIGGYSSASGFELRAISGDYDAGDQFILLYWPDTSGITQFDLYRRTEGNSYSSTPINSGPIKVWTDCGRIDSLIPPGSEEYLQLQNALYSAATIEGGGSATLGSLLEYGIFLDYSRLAITPASPSPISPASPMLPASPMFPSTPATPATPSIPSFSPITPMTEILYPGFPMESLFRFEPCSLTNVEEGSEADTAIQYLKMMYWKIAVIMGNAYADSSTNKGTTYYYKLTPRGNASSILDTVVITADDVDLPPAPSGVTAIPGDRQFLITWNRPDTSLWIIGYHIYRREGSTSYRINNALEVSDVFKIDTTTIGDSAIYSVNYSLCVVPGSSPAQFVACESCKKSFLDYLRWDVNGEPTFHTVIGDTIYGPLLGKNYRFRLTMVDYLGREGSFSSYTPNESCYDSTAPGAPPTVDVFPYKDSLVIEWKGVDYDIMAHIDTIAGYQVYRYDSLGDTTGGTAIGSLVPDDTSLVVEKYRIADKDLATLRQNYGERIFYYRVKAKDVHNNWSTSSAAGQGYLEDWIPPAPPT